MRVDMADRSRIFRQTYGSGRQCDCSDLRDVHLLRRQSADRQHFAATQPMGRLVRHARNGSTEQRSLARPGHADRSDGSRPPQYVALRPSGLGLALCVVAQCAGSVAQVRSGGVFVGGNRHDCLSRHLAQLRRYRRPCAGFCICGHEFLQWQQSGCERNSQCTAYIRSLDGRSSSRTELDLQGLRRARVGKDTSALRGVDLLDGPGDRLCHCKSSRMVAAYGTQVSLLHQCPRNLEQPFLYGDASVLLGVAPAVDRLRIGGTAGDVGLCRHRQPMAKTRAAVRLDRGLSRNLPDLLCAFPLPHSRRPRVDHVCGGGLRLALRRDARAPNLFCNRVGRVARGCGGLQRRSAK